MFEDNVLDRILEKTVNKCREAGYYIDREEVESVLSHIFDRLQYLFDLNKQGILKVGLIEVLNFGKFGTADGLRSFRLKRKKNKRVRKKEKLKNNET